MTDSDVQHDERCSEATSSSLLARGMKQDPAAWERIVELYSAMVFRWCTLGGLSADAALDVAQEVWITVYRKLPDFKPRHKMGSFRAWLRAITRSRFVDYTRRNPVVAQGGSDGQRLFNQLCFPEDDEASANADLQLLYRQVEDYIRSNFSEKHCEAFFRVAMQEEEPARVASSLGMTRNAVYLACARIRKSIRDEFDGLLGVAAPP